MANFLVYGLIVVILAGVVAAVRSPELRRRVPILICFLLGMMMVAAVFIPHEPFSGAEDKLSVFFDIIAAIGFILGGGNLIKIHGNKISRRSHHWQFSVVTLIGFFV